MNRSVLLSSPVFESSAPNILRELHRDQDFTDVTLVSADHQQIRAHKVILSAASPFFRDLLVRYPHTAPLLILKGIQGQELGHMLEFIYLGNTRLQEGLLDDFLAAGEELQIKGLVRGQGEPIEVLQEVGESLEVTNFEKSRSNIEGEWFKIRPTLGQVTLPDSEPDHSDKSEFMMKQDNTFTPETEIKEQGPQEQQTTSQDQMFGTMTSNFHKEMDSLSAKKKEFVENTVKPVSLSFSELVAPKFAPKHYSSNIVPAIFQCDKCVCKFQKENFLKIHITNKHSGMPQPVIKPRKRRSDQFVFKKN